MSFSPTCDVSVVIGFKDWGVERLLLSVRMLADALDGATSEVIVADYGSRDTAGLQSQLEELGARYVYTETDGVWSRSRALNSGFAVAGGRVLISTDADMAFSPSSLAVVVRDVLAEPNRALVLQCRDLPEGFGVERLQEASVDWTLLERRSRLRPRWGMGGMIAVSRESFDRVRGLDERMEIYGGEDIDFAQRLRRTGTSIRWVDDPAVRMYHIWHEPSRQAANATPEGEEAIKRNRDIYLHDHSPIRNVRNWRHSTPSAAPPATIVIATHNRAEFLGETMNSVLAQSVSDFELLIVDDGSTDETAAVVDAFDDERVRYVRQDNAGVAAARNHAAQLTRSEFTVVMDDDDLMLPWRLEAHFEALTGELGGTYGGWIDFDNEDGVMQPYPGKQASLATLLFAGSVYLHPTLMLRTDLIRKVGYDSTLPSGSDYMLGVSLLRAGVQLGHTGRYHILRRRHEGQLTAKAAPGQKTSAVLANFVARNNAKSAGVEELRKLAKATPPVTVDVAAVDSLVGFLPDELTTRSLILSKQGPDGLRSRVIANATWHDMAVARADGWDVEVVAGDGAEVDVALAATHLRRAIESPNGEPARAVVVGRRSAISLDSVPNGATETGTGADGLVMWSVEAPRTAMEMKALSDAHAGACVTLRVGQDLDIRELVHRASSVRQGSEQER